MPARTRTTRRPISAKLATAPVETEAGFQQAVWQAARLLGWRGYHSWTSINSVDGFPDLCLVRGERLVFAELKSAKGKVRPAQAEWLAALSATKAESYLWRPADWSTIMGVLA